MSIKYDPPKIISFSYEGKEKSDVYSIKYDEERKQVYLLEGEAEGVNDEWYAFPLDLLNETVDFIRNKNTKNPLRSNAKLSVPSVKMKDSDEPITVSVAIPSSEEVAKSSDDNNTFESFSQGEGAVVDIEKVIEQEAEKTKPKEEMVKRPVLDGNMPVEMAASVRGVGKGAEKRTIRRS